MKARDSVAEASGFLERHGVSEARLDAEILLAYVLGLDRTALLSQWRRELGEHESERFLQLSRRRALERVPVSYLVGEREFWSQPFVVTPDVLIPRPETECLVERALERMPRGEALRVLEVGVGCGALSAALALERPRALVVATDRSARALEVARLNLARLRLAGRVFLVRCDLTRGLRGPFDLLVSNPPYVPTDRIAELAPELRWEPSLALDGGTDGLALLRRLASEAPALLREGGEILLEVGHDQSKDVEALLCAVGGIPTGCSRDLAGRERVVGARFGRRS